MEHWMESDEEAQRRRRIFGSIFLLLLAAACLGLWGIGSRYMQALGITWLYPWMNWMMPGGCVLLLAWTLVLWMPVKPRTGKMLAAGLAVLYLAFLILSGVLSGIRVTVNLSPDRKHLVVLEEQKEDGTVTLCRSCYGLWKRKKEQFPYTVDGKLKYQWLEKDVCAITYKSPDQNTHQYLATFGDRGDSLSYRDPLTAAMGHWSIQDTNHAGWKLTIEGGNVLLENGSESFVFSDSDCVRFGTTAIALCSNGLPVWSLVLNEDCRINYDCLIARGGTLTLCPVSMEKTAPLTFVCTDAKEEYSEQNPYLNTEEEETDSREISMVETMCAYAQGSGGDQSPEGNEYGIFYVPCMDSEEAWNVRTALLTYQEPYRVNGVDCRVQIDSVQRLGGNEEDGLYEVKFTELCISPGNQGAGPEGETCTLTWKIRMMKGSEGYYAYVVNWREEGTYDLAGEPGEIWELSQEEEYQYFLAGTYDTTYMYVSRKDPEEGMKAVYQEELNGSYPSAAVSEYDGMPCMDLTGDKSTWLIYHGISEDYTYYEYRIIQTEDRGLSPDGRFEVLGNYRTIIQ